MDDGPILDAHIHLWDPRATPRTVSPRGLTFEPIIGWGRRAAFHDNTIAFHGLSDGPRSET